MQSTGKMTKLFLCGVSLLLVFLVLGWVPAVWAQLNGVVLWNKLGNDQEVQTSIIGPGGTRTGGAFTPGKFGGAYLATYTEDCQLTFPADVIPAARGTVDFWAQLINMPPQISTSGVALFGDVGGVYPSAQWTLGFAANNGCGQSGLNGSVGVAFNGFCYKLVKTATASWPSPGLRYDDILPPGTTGAWHHYAITWDEDGLPIAGGQRAALFLDGTMVSTRWLDRADATFDDPADYPGQVFGLLRIFENQGKAAIDNLIIRNVVKTDFSDRDTESPLVVNVSVPPNAYPWPPDAPGLEYGNRTGVDGPRIPLPTGPPSGGPYVTILYQSGCVAITQAPENPCVGPEGDMVTSPDFKNDYPGTSGTYFPSLHTPADWDTWVVALMGAFLDDSDNVIGVPFEVGTSRVLKGALGDSYASDFWS
jgi:hypothetical protein